MRIGRLFVRLSVLACTLPAVFLGSSYLMHERGLNLPISPYAVLIAWVAAALCVYKATVFQEFSARELLRLCAYLVLLCALGLLGLAVGFWAVTRVYGE
ncbi:hypothetical protein [Rubrivivax gelatinosus]|uniref:Uncharacterized protein n=1 Tax=Rubrivivax gelatinosus TaxID=28068 RepID=A0A4R2MQE9_RUBGE|nr:hypothetical protein [Rubrivivax gelatinosus]MBK1689358.1 hypothetical protein [Rubrivivax gelatinosus]TCP05376.1 hypothetical protein EV684_101248 [Rubrivivax gelatinosus]